MGQKIHANHGNDHLPGGADPIKRGAFHIKVSSDVEVLVTGDTQFAFAIPVDLNNYNLKSAQGYVSTVSSSGAVVVQVRNITQSADMLSTPVTIDTSAFTSYVSAAPSVVDTGADGVLIGDIIAIDVDSAGSGAQGLGVILEFATRLR